MSPLLFVLSLGLIGCIDFNPEEAEGYVPPEEVVVPEVEEEPVADEAEEADEGDGEEDGSDAEEEAAKKKKEPKEEVPKEGEGRTYAQPDAPMGEYERADILALCAAIADCDRERLRGDAETRRYEAIEAKSRWGKQLRRHLIYEGRAKAGPRVARLLTIENMKWESGDCRRVLKRYGRR